MDIDNLIDILSKIKDKGHNYPEQKIKVILGFLEDNEKRKSVALIADMGHGENLILYQKHYSINITTN